MFIVYEVFKSDGCRMPRFASEDEFLAEVWRQQHEYGTTALRNGWSDLIIEEGGTER